MSFIFNTSFKRSISEQEKYSDTFLPETPDNQLKTENIGINKTSELAGWSSGKDMKELKSSLDTIRRTASELITGIEEQLREIQRDREIMQEQAKESLLLVQNSDLSEYSLLHVRGMDGVEVVEALSAIVANREEQFLNGNTDRYGIYQLKDNPELRDFHFAGTAELLKRGILSDDFKEIQKGNYNLVYEGELSDIHGQSQKEKLNAIFEKFNINHPEDFRGHSLSVSDIVVLQENGKYSAHFVDSLGFTALPDFMRNLEGIKEQGVEKGEPEKVKDTSGHDFQKLEIKETKAEQETPQEPGQPEVPRDYPVFYGHSLNHAMEHGEVDIYLDSHRFDRECKKAIEGVIRENFDGMHLNHDIVKPLAEQYGPERMAFVLANTLQQELRDGRFSRDNKAWASEYLITENIVRGTDMNQELIVSSHPAVLDGFIDMFRKEVLEQEKELPEGQEKVTSGHDVDVRNPETEPEQIQTEQTEAEKPEPQTEESEPERPTETTEFKDMEDGDEIIDLGDEKGQVLAEMKKSLAGDKRLRAVLFPEQAEEKAWEIRMPDLSPAERLAVELDRFTFDYDTDLYHDNIQNMTENISELTKALMQGDTHDIALWLTDVIAEGTAPEETKRAKELLEKLAEYKPLAQIEEMEEQNYNMVDNVLNNGTGDKKAQEQEEKHVERTSLKQRLEQKKSQISRQHQHEERENNISLQNAARQQE